jgi:integrase
VSWLRGRVIGRGDRDGALREGRSQPLAGLSPQGARGYRENGFHALRHHFASVLLSGGVSIRALADYPGHIDTVFTLRVFAHLMPANDERMRTVVDAALAAAAGQTRDAEEGGRRFRRSAGCRWPHGYL